MKPTAYFQVQILGMNVAVFLLLCCLHTGEYVGVEGFVYRGLGERVKGRSVNGVSVCVGAV